MKLFIRFRVNTRSAFAIGQVFSAATPDHWLSRESTSQALKITDRCHGIHIVDTGH
jgi:hypothetical protein